MTSDHDDPRHGENSSEEPQSTPGYSGGTEGYSAPEEDAPPPKRKFWEALGFASFDEYLRHLKRLATLYQPLPRGAQVPTPKGFESPDDTVAQLDARPRPELRRRQVNIKLREAEGEALDRAAKIYGLAPATLARVLVNQGIEAILKEYED